MDNTERRIVPLLIEMRRGDRRGHVEMRMPTSASGLEWDIDYMRGQQRVMEEDRVYRYPLYLIAEEGGKVVEFESKPTDSLFLQDCE